MKRVHKERKHPDNKWNVKIMGTSSRDLFCFGLKLMGGKILFNVNPWSVSKRVNVRSYKLLFLSVYQNVNI